MHSSTDAKDSIQGIFFYGKNMNRKYKYYQQVKNLLEGLIVLPETDRDEDATLRSILELMTQMCAKHQQEDPEEQEAPQAPTEAPTMPVQPQGQPDMAQVAQRMGGQL